MVGLSNMDSLEQDKLPDMVERENDSLGSEEYKHFHEAVLRQNSIMPEEEIQALGGIFKKYNPEQIQQISSAVNIEKLDNSKNFTANPGTIETNIDLIMQDKFQNLGINEMPENLLSDKGREQKWVETVGGSKIPGKGAGAGSPGKGGRT